MLFFALLLHCIPLSAFALSGHPANLRRPAIGCKTIHSIRCLGDLYIIEFRERWIRNIAFSTYLQVASRILQNTNIRSRYMGICKSRHSQHTQPTRSAKQLWKWAVARIVWLLKLRRKWAHISKTILQHPSHQSLFEGLERRPGKLIRKKFIY